MERGNSCNRTSAKWHWPNGMQLFVNITSKQVERNKWQTFRLFASFSCLFFLIFLFGFFAGFCIYIAEGIRYVTTFESCYQRKRHVDRISYTFQLVTSRARVKSRRSRQKAINNSARNLHFIRLSGLYIQLHARMPTSKILRIFSNHFYPPPLSLCPSFIYLFF